MFRFAIFVFLFHSTLGIENTLYEYMKSDIFNIYNRTVTAIRELEGDPVSVKDVTFYLFTHNTSGVQLNQGNLDLFDDKKIVFLIHGWLSSKKIPWYEEMKNAFLKTHGEYSVVEVDWKKHASQLYDMSCLDTKDVAKFIADLIVKLNQDHNVSLDNILLIGHSLGGHISGFVAKYIFKQTGQKLPRIIALDPAGPVFVNRPNHERLNKDDAKVVEIIHSDGGKFGFEDATGTIDFFPNGGKSQPGCITIDFKHILSYISSLTDLVSCEHSRAGEYLVEAILNPNEFAAKKCADWKSYKKNKCEDEIVTLGNLTTNATGNFYLETNGKKPFAKHESEQEGIVESLGHALKSIFSHWKE